MKQAGQTGSIKKGRENGTKRGKELQILGAALFFRLAVYGLSAIVIAMMGQYEDGVSFSDFLEAFSRWDSGAYRNIAENGYMGAVEDGKHLFLVFFPLYPWLMRMLSLWIADLRLCGMLISVIGYGIGCLYFYRISKAEFGEKAAENALLLISLFPFGFFFGSIATEGLFFALSAAFLYYLREHRYGMTAFLGFWACLTRAQGNLLCFAVLIELFHSQRGIWLLRTRRWKEFFRKVIGPGCVCALMLLGFLVYLLLNELVEGDPFRFLYYLKSHWGNGFAPIWVTVKYVTENAISNWNTEIGASLWCPEFFLIFLYLAALVYGIRQKIRPMYFAYLLVYFLLTYSTSWLLSAGRYTLCALPLFMLGGKWLSEKEKLRIPVLLLSAMLFMIYYTGYFSWKQIM